MAKIEKKEKNELPVSEAESQFDEKFGSLKEANPGLYNELKQEHLNQSETIEKQKKELKEALADPTTGLEIRKQLFINMHAEIGALLGISNIQEMDPDELREKLLGINPDEYEDMPLYVMMSDMSYLSLANKSGHKAGDELLASVGQATQESLHGFRHGGDEITALIKLNDAECENAIKNFKKNVQNADCPEILKQYGLKPNVDAGVAHFSEGLRAFQELMQTPEGAEVLRDKNPLKELENIWLEIADKRAELEKGKARIKLLMDLIKEAPEDFKDLYGFLNKGGYSITEEELHDLNAQVEAGENTESTIINFIRQKEKADQEMLERYNARKDKIISQIIESQASRAKKLLAA